MTEGSRQSGGSRQRPPRPASSTPVTRAPRTRRLPKIGRHSSGQARVTLGGVVHYLGRYGSLEAQRRYVELIEQWQRDGCRPPKRGVSCVQSCTTVRDLLQLYLDTIDRTGRYQKAGRPTTQRRYVERVCRSFAEHCGDVPVGRLNKGLLVTWRDRIEEDRGQTRTTINKKQAAVKRMLAWAAERDLVPENVWHAMNSVRPLRRGEVGDRPERGKPRRAVTWAEVVQVAEQCSPQVAAMLRLQALTSMRPGEVVSMRWSDIDRSQTNHDGWVYRVRNGKTSHHGTETTYLLKDQAQAILAGFPATPNAHIFSPRTAMEERRLALRATRTSKVTKQTEQRDRGRRRTYADCWGLNEYRRAVQRACTKAGIAPFTPHEVRHGAITHVARTAGLLAAQRGANHTSSQTTARYLHTSEADAASAAASLQERAATG